MKKQILLLAIFTLTILAGTKSAVGQALDASTTPTPIIPLSCISSSEPLHPFPGIPYKYSLDGDNGTEHAAYYTWWATKDVDFISGVVNITGMVNTNFDDRLTVSGTELMAVGSTYGTTTPVTTVGADSVTITWTPAILSGTTYQGDGVAPNGTPTFVVGYVEGDNCADNIQVYEINPKPNFTIDIAAIDFGPDTTMAWGEIDSVCVDVIQSATYNTTTHELDSDFGENAIYFEVSAANFVKDWTPTFQIISGLRTTQTAILSMYSSYADAKASNGALFTSASIDETGMNTDIATGIHLTATDPLDVATGVSVFVKVVIDNDTEESLTYNDFVLAVDAQDNTETGIWDMEDEDCTTLVDDPDQVDQAQITVTPRPRLDHNTVDSPTGPEPTNVVPKVDMTAYPRF